MATIVLEHETTSDAVDRVWALLDEVAREPAWNGADFVLAWGDHTCIEGADEIAGAALLARVFRAIEGEE